MIKSYSIVIDEVDEAEFALEQLNAQMAEIKLLKNSIGIVSVKTDFINSGVYAAVAKAVPFPLLGMTSYSQAVNGQAGMFLFSILILTSDSCQFAHGVSDIIPEKDDVKKVTQDLYKGISSKINENAKLALLYSPLMLHQCPYNYLKAISEINERIPVFGSLASVEIAKLATDTRTVYGEEIFENRLVMLLISGDVSPEFYIGSVPKSSIAMPDIGEATAAKDNHLMEVNNVPISEFFEKVGFSLGALENEGTLTTVFIVDEKDKDGKLISSAARSFLTINDGVGVFGGNIPVGSVLSIAVISKDDIVSTSKGIAAQIKAKHRDKTILMYSCLGKQIALLDEPMKEFEALNDEFKDSGLSYVVASSGGEICPTSVSETKAYNNEHNQSLVVCVI
jgi:hypothetical protein